MKDLLLITPPFTQINTPYPATMYLKGFLNTRGISNFQSDLGLEVILELFNKKGIGRLFDNAKTKTDISENAAQILSLRSVYENIVDDVIRFLQGHNNTLARQICAGNYLPEASRFAHLEDIDWAFGNMGQQDKAKHLATLFLEDVSDFIIECIDPHFGFSRYAEKLGMSAASFDELHNRLQQAPSFIDEITLNILNNLLQNIQPKIVAFSVPFPGNLYSAFRCAQFIKKNFPSIKTVMGGGFPNTELRSLKDRRVFEYFDLITLDDGELPIELICSNILNPNNSNAETNTFKRTYILNNDKVEYNNSSNREDYHISETGTPDYSDLLLDKYISVIEVANPMHSLWSDGKWNKLTMAHGCYWGKCAFCDGSLDYIKNYKPVPASQIVDRMEEIIEQTGETGFHFVDEAAPPKLMREVAVEIIKRNLSVTWWTNVRFEKSFTPDLCQLLGASGCVAVAGGLEVASKRLLALINKGVTLPQVAKVTANFTDAGIMVHAYLMYGFPTQNIQETVDSLEVVRQLFELGIVQSGFWHRFALTAHSPVGLDPEQYKITPHRKEISFAENEVAFSDSTKIDHERFSFGLKKSIFNFMHGVGFDMPAHEWFLPQPDITRIPKTTISPNFIQKHAEADDDFFVKPNAKIIWLGTTPLTEEIVKKKKGKTFLMMKMKFFTKNGIHTISLENEKALWLKSVLETASIYKDIYPNFSELKADFEKQFDSFELFWYSKQVQSLRPLGLLTS